MEKLEKKCLLIFKMVFKQMVLFIYCISKFSTLLYVWDHILYHTQSPPTRFPQLGYLMYGCHYATKNKQF